MRHGGEEVPDYMIFLQLGDFTGCPKTTFFYGTEEVLYALAPSVEDVRQTLEGRGIWMGRNKMNMGGFPSMINAVFPAALVEAGYTVFKSAVQTAPVPEKKSLTFSKSSAIIIHSVWRKRKSDFAAHFFNIRERYKRYADTIHPIRQNACIFLLKRGGKTWNQNRMRIWRRNRLAG